MLYDIGTLHRSFMNLLNYDGNIKQVTLEKQRYIYYLLVCNEALGAKGLEYMMRYPGVHKYVLLSNGIGGFRSSIYKIFSPETSCLLWYFPSPSHQVFQPLQECTSPTSQQNRHPW